MKIQKTAENDYLENCMKQEFKIIDLSASLHCFYFLIYKEFLRTNHLPTI